MVRTIILKDRSEWLRNRDRIGGSDASSILGMNPYKDNVELWRIKTGLQEAEDISDKPYVKYGTEAEPHLREPDTKGPRGGIRRGKLLENECSYVADFVYEENETTIVEDTKGFRTDAYIIKRKLMLERYGIQIREV